jgi:large subunit ribosomal protein L22
MEAIAKLRHIKGSPRKARLVIDLIRGRNVSQALAILKFTNKRAAQPIAKCLNSAIANATYLAEQKNIAVDPDDLWVKTCFVDMGAHKNRRRMRPAPQGRAYREQRHYCHITIEVTSEAPAQKENDKPRKEGKKLQAKRAQAAESKQSNDKPQGKKSKNAPKAEAEEINEAKVQSETVETVEQPQENQTEQVEKQEAQNEADAADAKDATSQTPAEKHETKPADDAQESINEQLERQ